MNLTTLHPRIILFDGVCNLCNRSIQTVIHHDPQEKFSFASLQGSSGQALLTQFQLLDQQLNSFILIQNGKAYVKSTAALKVASQLQGWWKILYLFILVPPFLRDFVYTQIARNRYRWFGKKDQCMVPTQALKKRFLP